MLSLCMCKEAGGGGGGEGARDTESKTRTPHKVVGKNMEHRYTHDSHHGIATSKAPISRCRSANLALSKNPGASKQVPSGNLT